MEPMNRVVHLTPGACEIWIGTQVITRVQSAVAKATGLPVEKVTVHQHLIGGGFGRRLEPDMAVVAGRIAHKGDRPVKVVWGRAESIPHHIYPPGYLGPRPATLEEGNDPRRD